MTRKQMLEGIANKVIGQSPVRAEFLRQQNKYSTAIIAETFFGFFIWEQCRVLVHNNFWNKNS